jgi:thiamine-phosphate pyrophosphorylase
MPLNPSRPILYLITRGATTKATTADAPEFAQILNQISRAVAAGIDLIQIREKQMTPRALFELVTEAAKLTRVSTTNLLVNDRADIAAGAGADGVHLTSQSLDAATIRRTFGADFLIGASTHSLDEGRAARDQGANFVVYGPVFETNSKRAFGLAKGVGDLSEVVRALGDFPVLALGGITLSNAADCLAGGAAGIAGISLFDKPGSFAKLCDTIRQGKESVDQ